MKAETEFENYLLDKGYSLITSMNYTNTINRYLNWLQKQDITPEAARYGDILAYIQKLKPSNKQGTIQQSTAILNLSYRHLQSEGIIHENPASNIFIKGVERNHLHNILKPDELDCIYQSYEVEKRCEGMEHRKALNTRIPPQHGHELSRARNKAILGLIIYQAIRSEELAKLKPSDLKLKEGQIFIPGSKKHESRTLTLQAHQVYQLMDYLHNTRKEILSKGENDEKQKRLFVNVGKSEKFQGILLGLIKSLKRKNKEVKSLAQLRASVISNWLKTHNLRRVQYMAGHRYVSSTEAYQRHDIEDLQQDVARFHPLG